MPRYNLIQSAHKNLPKISSHSFLNTRTQFNSTSVLKRGGINTESADTLYSTNFNTHRKHHSVSTNTKFMTTSNHLSSEINKGHVTFYNPQMQIPTDHSTSRRSKLPLKDKLRFNERDGVAGLNQLQQLMTNLSENKAVTKYEVLPRLIEMVKQCLEEKQDFEQFQLNF